MTSEASTPATDLAVTLEKRLADARSQLQALRERISRGDCPGTDRCQFCLGVKGGEPGRERPIGGALACAECFELANAAIDNAAPVDRVASMENALRHIELLAFTGTQTAVARGDDDGQRRAALFREIREAARAVVSAPITDAADLGRVIRDAGARAARIAQQEATGERVGLVTPLGGTVTDPDELEMHRQLRAQNVSRCTSCQNTGWLVEGSIFCECPYGEFLAKKIRATDVIPGERTEGA